MNYYDLTDEQQKRLGVDYDFCACLENNPQPFNLLDVDRVLAVHAGERDGPDWFWVVLLRDGRYAYLQGGCDYTGWDCRSSASTAFYSTAEAAARGSVPDRLATNTPAIQDDLLQQIAQGRSLTWREKKDIEFGLRGGAE